MAIVAEDDVLQIEKLVLGPYSTNTYILVCQKTKESVLIDTPAEANAILEKMKDTNPKYILLTHNHVDHIGALTECHSSLNVPLCAHALDSARLPVAPEIMLNDGDTISVGKLVLEVLHTPGHTPGSLCFKVGSYLLSGDTIFAAGPGKTGSPNALKQIVESITEKIFVLRDETQVYPGHGEDTILKKEKEEYAVFSSRPHDPGLCGDIVWLTS